MEDDILISSNLIKKINDTTLDKKNACGGLLFGLEFNKKKHILGSYICDDSMVQKKYPKEGIQSEYIALNSYLPQGINIFGIFFKTSKLEEVENIICLCKHVICETSGLLEMYEEGDLEDSEFLILLIDKDNKTNSIYRYCFSNSDIETCRLNVIQDNKSLDKQLVWFHLKAFFPLTLRIDSKSDDLEEFDELIKDINESSKYYFDLNSSGIYLKKDKLKKMTINDAISQINKDNILEKNIKSTNLIIIPVQTYSNASNAEKASLFAPVVLHEKFSVVSVCVDLVLPVDVLIVASRKDQVDSLDEHFRSAIAKQISNFKTFIAVNNNFEEATEVKMPKAFHYLSPQLNIFLTLLLAKDVKLESNVDDMLVDKLMLDEGAKAFARQSAVNFENFSSKYPLNVHFGLAPPKVADGVSHLVDGSYEYRHYLQDGFQDDGWGCAYRSLQTIVSWFRLQNLTEVPVPSHREIQQALVDVGDKPPSFVGTRKWIGSTEVSYVLNKLLNIDSRICHVSDGSEMASQARLISRHFQTNGSPVMIGGGVLAHTIIGICWNELTGDVKYLVLDPHYTGGDNVKTIQNKGWCGWKGGEFWKKNVFYNMCMPLIAKTN